MTTFHRSSSRAALRTLSSLAVAAALCFGTAAHAQDTLRPDMAKPLAAAQELLRNGDATKAMEQLRLAENQEGRTDYENYILARLKAPAAMALNDNDAALKAFNAALTSPKLDPKDRPSLLETAVAVAYRAKNNAEAERLARVYLAEGGQAESVRVVLVFVLNARGESAAMLKELDVLIKADQAAGRKVAELRWQLQGSAQNKLGDAAGYRATLEQLVQDYPKPAYWQDLVSRVQGAPGFASRLGLDVLRLMRHLNLLTEADEYADLAQLAQLSGQPIEAKAVLDEGFERKLLGEGKSAAQHQQLRQKINKQAADDRAALASAKNDAAKAKDGGVPVAVGQLLISAGDTAGGLELMAQGLQRGVAKNPDDARLRYGVALLQAGQRDKALPVLQALAAKDGTADLARLWLLAVR